MSFISEFKQFAMRGNVMDLAIGVIIGGAFGKIISSLVADIVMPLLGLIVGGVDFTKLAITLHSAEGATPALVLAYGQFLQNIFDFTIIAFAIFTVIKLLNKFKKQENTSAEQTPIVLSKSEELLTEIVELLKNK